MTRILYWNLENFSVNKFGEIVGGLFTEDSTDRLDYFHYALDNDIPNGTPANAARTPEIVVIVELETGNSVRSNLVTGNGPRAAQELINYTRHWTGNNHWMAVPPLYTGRKEGVIVLYDSTNLIFTGPNIWPGGFGPSAIPPAGVFGLGAQPPSPYPAGWDNYIRTGPVLGRPIPAGTLYNANRWENSVAARVAGFTSSAGAGLVPLPLGMPAAGLAMDGNLGPRTPYMVTFFRPLPAENITLFAIHSPANYLAHDYMTALACTREIANAPVGNERKVVVGDFNFNLFNNAGAVRQRYQYFTQLGYDLGIAPVPIPPVGIPVPVFTSQYHEYFATHLSKRKHAINWTDATAIRDYPGYGYFSDDNPCIDNIFVRGGALTRTTILNPVVGAPYNVLPGGVPPGWLTPAMRGHFEIECLCPCYEPPNPLPQWQAPQYLPGMRQLFRGWANFWRIRSTSDHLPIIADF